MLKWNHSIPGVQAAELLPSHQEWRQPPINLVPADEALFAHELKRSWGSCEVVALDSLRVVGSSWLQLRYGRIMDYLRPRHGSPRRKRDRFKDLAQLRYPLQHVAKALWVHDDWSGNYFHWLTDVLPKLQAWHEAGGECRYVLLPEHVLQKNFIGESLSRLGFEAISFAGLNIKIGRLIVISPTAPTGNFRSGLLQRLRHQLCGSIHKGEPVDKFYISRVDAPKRFLRNEVELEPILATHSIQVMQLEGRSLMEQIELFANCNFLVGLHGAGLTNMLWMPPGARVLEIRRRGDHHNNCYFAMASALGHRYCYLLAEDMLGSQDTLSAELWLDPQMMEYQLQEASQC